MKLKLGVISINLLIGVKDAKHAGEALDSTEFKAELTQLLLNYKIVILDVQGTGLVGEGYLETEEPKALLIN